MTSRDQTGVLFVCTGNICRSPLAEGIFRHRANQGGAVNQFRIDSAGTGDWHVGEAPDRRVQAVAAEHGLVLTGRARQVTERDLSTFDHLICMDESHRRQLLDWGAPSGKLRLLLDVDATTAVREVPDPYYGGPDGFETVYALIESACDALLAELLAGPPPTA